MGNQPWLRVLEEEADRLAEQGFVPDYTNVPVHTYNVPMPRAPEDKMMFPDEPYALPPDWDYKTSETDPDGVPLSEFGPSPQYGPEWSRSHGAVGWTPHGKPYYGTDNAFTEWSAGVWNAITGPVRQTSEDAWKEATDSAAAAINNLLAGNFAEVFGPAINAISQTITTIADVGLEKGEVPGGLRAALPTAGRALGQLVQGFGLGLDQIFSQILIRQGVMGTVGGIEDIAATGELPEVELIPTEWVNAQSEKLPDNFIGDAARWILGFLDTIDPIALSWNAIRAVAAPGTLEEKGEIVSESWRASKVLYSSWIEPATKDEYIRRIRAGENPYLVAEEISNPLAEMAGDIIFDYLNIYGWLSKGKHASKMVVTAKTRMMTPAPEVAKHLDNLHTASKIGDGAPITKGTITFMERIRKGVGEVGTGLRSLTQKGKRNILQAEASDFIGNIAKTFEGDPDKAYEVLRGLYLRSSQNAEDVAQGIAILGKSGMPMELLFSEVGGNFSHVLRNIVGDNPAVFADLVKAQKTPADLVTNVLPLIEKAVDKLVPSLADMAKRGDDIGNMGKALIRAEKVANSKALTGINSFFAHIYMGMNPGYVVRNIITNSFHILVDQDLPTATKAFKSQVAAAFGRTDAGLRGARASIEAKLGYVPGFATEGIGAAGIRKKGPKWFGRGLLAAADSESAAATHIVARSLKKTFKMMLQPGRAIPDIAPLVNGGMDMKSATYLQSLLIKHNGDVKQALALFRTELATGYIDTFRALDWVETVDKDMMDSYGLWTRYKGVIDNKEMGLEDMERAIREIFEDAHTMGEGVNKEIRFAARDGAHIDDVKNLETDVAYSEFINDNGKVRAYLNQKGFNEAADGAYSNLLRETIVRARSSGVDIDAIIAENPKFQELYQGILWQEANEAALAKQATVGHWARTVKEDPAQIGRAWREVGLPGEAPVGISGQQAADYFWDGYFRPWNAKHFAEFRDANALLTQEVLARITASGQMQSRDLAWINRTQGEALGSLKQAQDWDYGIVDKAGNGIFIGNGAKLDYDDMNRLAILNGIPTASKTGVPAEQHLLAIVKQQTGQDFKKLYDVPYDVAHKALQSRATEKGLDFIDLKRQTVPLRVNIDIGKAREDADKVLRELGMDDFAERAIERGIATEAGEVGDVVRSLPSAYDGSMPPSTSRPWYEARKEFEGLEQRLLEGLQQNWGKRERTVGSPAIDAALLEWEKEAVKSMSEMRATAIEVAKADRRFAIHLYGEKRNFDTVFGLIYPYQYWYSRTYANWLQRLARNPAIMVHYMRYREMMEKIHAGAPEWYKYQINSNELLGMDSDNPLFFNLEQSVNPLHGLTNVNFEDPYRRVGWWTTMLDNMNRYGPSTHPLLSIATAFGLMVEGEEAAAARWGGRLAPITKVFKSIDALVGDDPVQDYDPFVQIFAGGIDPYAERKAGRALGAMQDEGLITGEQNIDASFSQEGAIWEEAVLRAERQSAPGQLSSFFLGAGFKARTIADLQIDQMYTDFFRVMEVRDNVSPEEFRMMFDQLRTQYPFMDGVLLSRKGGDERDTSLAYTVLARIPPGDSEILELAGLSYDLVGKFYDDKGDFSEWIEGDKLRFMAGIVDMSAILKIPTDATRQEWSAAKAMYSQVRQIMTDNWGTKVAFKDIGKLAAINEIPTERLLGIINRHAGTNYTSLQQIPYEIAHKALKNYKDRDFVDIQRGEDIHEKIDQFYAYFDDTPEGKEKAYAFLEKHPEVAAALDFKAGVIASNPEGLMATYYGGVKQIEDYYNGLMYNQAERLYGKDIWDIQDGYYLLQKGERRAYKAKYPQLEKYWEYTRKRKAAIDQAVISLGSRLRDGLPVDVRQDQEEMSFMAQQLLLGIQQPPPEYLSYTPQQWQATLGPIVYDYVLQAVAGQEIPWVATESVDTQAERLGIDRRRLIQLVGIALARSRTGLLK